MDFTLLSELIVVFLVNWVIVGIYVVPYEVKVDRKRAEKSSSIVMWISIKTQIKRSESEGNGQQCVYMGHYSTLLR